MKSLIRIYRIKVILELFAFEMLIISLKAVTISAIMMTFVAFFRPLREVLLGIFRLSWDRSLIRGLILEVISSYAPYLNLSRVMPTFGNQFR